MEKNIPFLSISAADRAYNKLVIPFLRKLDDGNVFKNIITLLLTAIAFTLLLGGIYLCISGLFGDNGFITNYITDDGLSGGKKVGAFFGLLLGFLLSLVSSWFLYSILKKRTDELSAVEYKGLLHYVFVNVIPKFILVTGELLFVLVLLTGLLQTIAALVGSYVYAPLSEFPSTLLKMFPGMGVFGQIIPNSMAGDYDMFTETLKIGLIGVAGSFIVLISFYIYKEVYNYALKLLTSLIAFLPKFAVPVALRLKREN